MIQTEHLRYTYANAGQDKVKFVLDDIDLTVDEGEFVAVLGHNGCGKSTLAKHFNGLLLPSGGTVYVDGMDTKKEEHYWDIRKAVSAEAGDLMNHQCHNPTFTDKPIKQEYWTGAA